MKILISLSTEFKPQIGSYWKLRVDKKLGDYSGLRVKLLKGDEEFSSPRNKGKANEQYYVQSGPAEPRSKR